MSDQSLYTQSPIESNFEITNCPMRQNLVASSSPFASPVNQLQTLYSSIKQKHSPQSQPATGFWYSLF